MKRKTWLMLAGAVLLLPLAASWLLYAARADYSVDWRDARRDSSGLAPAPGETPEAVIQVYAAHAYRWRGVFGVHTWIAAKPRASDHYTRFEVMGFGVSRGRQAVRVHQGTADGYWFGNPPMLLREVRGGAEVDALIERLRTAAQQYPYQDFYRIWPGPNSNTFIAYLARAVPELRVDLPANAIGKDYLPGNAWYAATVSGTGAQLSAFGLIGMSAALEEGLELNVLGLSVGLDLWPPALKVPGIGRLGWAQHQAGSDWFGVRYLPEHTAASD